jgi:GT2 family glycosyltransferase
MPNVRTGKATGSPTLAAPTSSAAVVIVSFNTRELLATCLASVLAEKPSSVVVVDNASSDGSAEMVQRDFPHIDVIANGVNHGYGAGANQGIARCLEPVVVLLNGDTALRPGGLAALSRELDLHPDAAVVGPRLLNTDGTIQPSCFQFPSPLQTVLRTTFLGAVVDRIPPLHRRHRYAWSPNASESVPWVLGAAIALRHEAFSAVGEFDSSFFMFSEEVDLSFRLALAGWQTRFTPLAQVVHTGGASTRQHAVEMEARRYSATRRFYEKHYSPAAMRLLTGMTKYRMLHNLARDRLRQNFARDDGERARLAERVIVWRTVLRAWDEK